MDTAKRKAHRAIDMDYEEAMKALDQNGFKWEDFREIFPFGDISLREGNYQRLVSKCLSLLPSLEQKIRLLDLLDAQGSVFLEQCWVQNELTTGQESPFQIHAHFALAWLQINSNLRHELDLPARDTRSAMLKLSLQETLAERLVVPVTHRE